MIDVKFSKDALLCNERSHPFQRQPSDVATCSQSVPQSRSIAISGLASLEKIYQEALMSRAGFARTRTTNVNDAVNCRTLPRALRSRVNEST